MAGLTVKSDNTDDVVSEIKNSVDKALEQIGIAAENYAKALCPVGTPESTGIPGYKGGTLRNSITHDVDGSDVYIGTNEIYGKYVEMGTYKMDARPFLRPAANDHAQEYRDILKSALSG